MKELERHGYKLTPGTLYPILHKLEQRGFIESYTKIVEGKKRKYYEITPQGSRVIEEINPKIKELVEEVLK